jgi:hypothetical protein
MSSASIDKVALEGCGPEDDPIAQRVSEAVRGVRFGSVEITIHEGRVVQIERRERVRLEISARDSSKQG